MTAAAAASLTLSSSDNTGLLTLSGTNGYSGGTTVQSGTLILDGASSLLAGSNLTISVATPAQVLCSRRRRRPHSLNRRPHSRRPAAVAEAQAEINERAERKAKEVSTDTPETKTAIDAMRRIIDAYENGEQISHTDRNAYAQNSAFLKNAAVNKGLDVKHYLKAAGIIDKYWFNIPEQPKPEPTQSYEESAAAVPEPTAPGPNDGL